MWSIKSACSSSLTMDVEADQGRRADVNASLVISWLDALWSASVLVASHHCRQSKQVIDLTSGLMASKVWLAYGFFWGGWCSQRKIRMESNSYINFYQIFTRIKMRFWMLSIVNTKKIA
jgi:hypothetical protein